MLLSSSNGSGGQQCQDALSFLEYSWRAVTAGVVIAAAAKAISSAMCYLRQLEAEVTTLRAEVRDLKESCAHLVTFAQRAVAWRPTAPLVMSDEEEGDEEEEAWYVGAFKNLGRSPEAHAMEEEEGAEGKADATDKNTENSHEAEAMDEKQKAAVEEEEEEEEEETKKAESTETKVGSFHEVEAMGERQQADKQEEEEGEEEEAMEVKARKTHEAEAMDQKQKADKDEEEEEEAQERLEATEMQMRSISEAEAMEENQKAEKEGEEEAEALKQAWATDLETGENLEFQAMEEEQQVAMAKEGFEAEEAEKKVEASDTETGNVCENQAMWEEQRVANEEEEKAEDMVEATSMEKEKDDIDYWDRYHREWMQGKVEHGRAQPKAQWIPENQKVLKDSVPGAADQSVRQPLLCHRPDAAGSGQNAARIMQPQTSPKHRRWLDTLSPTCLDDLWVRMKYCEGWGEWPYCTACGCWSDNYHVETKRHQEKLASWRANPWGELL